MNLTLWDYDIETDRVARFVRGLYWFIWVFLTPVAVLAVLFYVWALLTYDPPGGVERAEEEQRKVEKRIETVENYYRY